MGDESENCRAAHSYLALALLRSADTVAAAEEFRKELANDPNDFDANLQLGGLLRQEDKLVEARKLIEHALSIRVGDFAARYQIATIDMTEGKIEDARKGLESIVKEAPSSPRRTFRSRPLITARSGKRMATASATSSRS